MLAASGINHTVSVASQYGSDVMSKDPHVRVKIGRMDEHEMYDLLAGEGFGEGDIIVDATHPYAAAVSDNIKDAAQKAGCMLYRITRQSEKIAAGELYDRFEHHGSMEEFAKSIDRASGNILLTTGSNTLGVYCENVSYETLARTYVRVLPAKESIDICHDCGIETSHIIAMQGPFTYEMNRALFAQFDIKHMLTKDSGAAGGFAEKVRAARDLGVAVHVLERPENADDPKRSDNKNKDLDAAGMTATGGEDIYAVYEKITGSAFVPKRNIVLAGIGPGSEKCMTVEVAEHVKRADAVFGAASVTANIKASKKYDMYLAKDIIKVLENEKDLTDIAVLFSGDPSFYSGAREAYAAFKKWDKDAYVTILPGVSSVSYLAAKLGESYDDALIVSIHGRNSLHNIDNLVDSIGQNAKVFALLSDDGDLRNVAGKLTEKGIPATVHIGRNLSYIPVEKDRQNVCDDGESIVSMSTKETENYHGAGKITVLFKNDRI